MSIVKQLAEYSAWIELTNKGKEMEREIYEMQNTYQQLSSVFWLLKFLIDNNCLETETAKQVLEKIKEFKRQNQGQIIQDSLYELKNKCRSIIFSLGRDLEIIIEGAELLGIEDCPRVNWKDKIMEIKDEQSYTKMNSLYKDIMKCKNECIKLIDQKLKLKDAREVFLKVLREGEVKLSEFSTKQIEEIMGSPLCHYLYVKLREG